MDSVRVEMGPGEISFGRSNTRKVDGADAAMFARARIVIVAAAAAIAVLPGGAAWLAGRNAPWAHFFATHGTVATLEEKSEAE